MDEQAGNRRLTNQAAEMRPLALMGKTNVEVSNQLKVKLFALAFFASMSIDSLASIKGSELESQLTQQTIEGEAYLAGLADGFLMRDAIRMKPSAYEYCMPVMERLSAEDYREILQGQLKDPAKKDYAHYLPAYLLLLMGMHERYPCAAK